MAAVMIQVYCCWVPPISATITGRALPTMVLATIATKSVSSSPVRTLRICWCSASAARACSGLMPA